MSALVSLDWMGPEVAWIRLNDPQRLNAMGQPMSQDFSRVIDGLKEQTPLRAVVLSGNGPSFCAGGDREMLRSKSQQGWDQNRHEMLSFYRSFMDILQLEVPLVAAVQGWAVGAGCLLVAACDIRLADPASRFRVPFLSLGLFPGMGSSFWLPHRLGPWANDFVLTGSTLTAEQAAQRGLITQVSAPGQVEELAKSTVETLLANRPQVTRDWIRLIREQQRQLWPALQREAELQSVSYSRPELYLGG